MLDILSTALDWLHQGIAPIPILYKNKRPDANLLPLKYDEDGNLIYLDNGKPKHTWEPYQKRLPTEEEIKRWFSTRHNLAIITGWQNLVVVDFDDFIVYNDWQKDSSLPATYSVLTTRGVHCYFFLKNPVSGFMLPGIDVKAGGGYVLVPPSIHPSGTAYTALDKSTPILSVDGIGDILDIPSIVQIAKPKPIRGNGRGDLVSRIKRSYPILDFFPDAKKSGDGWYVTRCPYHDDKNPSFWIDAKRDLCGCFAGCTKLPWDVIDLWAVENDLSIEEAIADMQDRM